MNSLTHLSRRIYDRHLYMEERKQAYTRLFYLTVVIIPVIALLDHQQHIHSHHLWIGIGLYALAALGHLKFLLRHLRTAKEARKIFAIFIDIAFVTLIVAQLHIYGFLFSILYLWVIVGNGMRFGKTKIFVATAFSIIGIVTLYLFSPFWSRHPLLVLHMLLEVLVIPPFVARLVQRLEEKEAILASLLEKSEHFATHDTLTGIENRYAFEERLKQKIRSDKPFSLLFVDLDGFKQVNDTLGHDAGDRVLKEVAERLEELHNQMESVDIARLGGDEFAVIVEGELDRAIPVAKTALEALRHPYEDGKIDYISASIGLAHHPSHGKTPFDIKKSADLAMYQAKQSGKDQMAIFEPHHKH